MSKILLSFLVTIILINRLEQKPNFTRAPASSVQKPLSIKASSKILRVCGVDFEELSYSTEGKSSISLKFVHLPQTSFKYPVPDKLESGVDQVKNFSTFQHRLRYPILPSIPITPKGLTPELCQSVRRYHSEFLRKGPRIIRMAPESLEESREAEIALEQQKDYLRSVNRQVGPDYKLVIYYDDLYEDEALALAALKESLGFHTLAVAVSSLPGMNAGEPIPDDCQGDFLKECYHTWGDPITGVSQRAVPSLKGYHAETKIYEQYERVAYVPGLIRAHLRELKRQNPIQGVLLIGSDEVITPYHVPISRYGHTEPSPAMTTSKLHTDIFYMIPDLPLILHPKLEHATVMPFMWSCKNVTTNRTRRAYWCENNEVRHWPVPALTAYRTAPFTPLARIFSPKYAWNGSFFRNLSLDSIIPVGRIPTQEHHLGHKDPIVSTYLDKVRRWHRELPMMKNNSILSNGGSSADTWIFTQEDITTFNQTYGSTSKVYASEVFLPLAKCIGCQYKTGPDIFAESGLRNRTAMMINGHGGHSGVQAPYGIGDVHSEYRSENFWRNEWELRRTLIGHPSHNTLRVLHSAGKLVGHVFANSCDLSNFNMDNFYDKLMLGLDPSANQRSLAEQWLQLEDAGALNVFMNSDVGWGGSDNAYNVKFMKKVELAWDACGTIGDAYKLTVADMVKGQTGGAGEWQLYNRQMFGSPLNRIARRPAHCDTSGPVVDDTQTEE